MANKPTKQCLKEYFPSMPDHFQIWCDAYDGFPDRIYYSNDYYIYASGHIPTTYWCKGFTDEEKLIWVIRFGEYLPSNMDQL